MKFITLLLILNFILLVTDSDSVFVLAGNSRKRNRKKSKQRAADKLQKKLDDIKLEIKAQKCGDDEDEWQSFNCLNYNLSPKCFVEVFGQRGIEFGEIVREDTQS